MVVGAHGVDLVVVVKHVDDELAQEQEPVRIQVRQMVE